MDESRVFFLLEALKVLVTGRYFIFAPCYFVVAKRKHEHEELCKTKTIPIVSNPYVDY